MSSNLHITDESVDDYMLCSFCGENEANGVLEVASGVILCCSNCAELELPELLAKSITLDHDQHSNKYLQAEEALRSVERGFWRSVVARLSFEEQSDVSVK